MKTRCALPLRPRRGAVLPLVTLLLVVLFAMLAFTFDLGRVAVFRAQLQNAADSSALAGAAALGNDNLVRPLLYVNQSNDLMTVRSQAQTFAQANGLDLNGRTAVVMDKTSDISYGTLSSPSLLTQALDVSGLSAYNSVHVNTYADAAHGGGVPFLFAKVMGINSTAAATSATATVEVHRIESLRALPNLRSPILPITMAVADWQDMVNGTTGIDIYKFNMSSGKVASGSDGLQEQQLYPSSTQSPSNKGLLQFGVNSHSDSVLSDQIVNGPTQAQLLAEWPSTSGAPPWSAQHTLQNGADPGWRAANFDDLTTVAAAGLPRLIPINDGTNPGNGANGVYTIVRFAPVRVVVSNKGGSSSGYVRVQPAVITDPTVVGGSLAAAGEGGVPMVRLTR